MIGGTSGFVLAIVVGLCWSQLTQFPLWVRIFGALVTGAMMTEMADRMHLP